MADNKPSLNRPWRPTPENMRLKPAPTEPVQCPDCDQAFTTVAEAVAHAKTHQTERHQT